MKFKKIAAGVLALAMAASMAGCGGSGTSDNAASTTASASADAGNDGDTADNSGSSASSTGDVPSFSELYGDETIQLTAYSQLANYSGKLTGWFAKILKDKFNCEITIIPEADGAFDTRMEAGDLGDLVVFGSTGTNYQRAALGGLLFDWNEDDILSDYGPYIKEHMPYAIQNNAQLSDSFGAGETVYGIGHNIATNPEDHEAFFYTMDVRYDLYKELGYPEIKTMDDFFDLMVKMKEICPTDETGSETYATSLWPDWDGNMVMYVKAFATCYYGYDEMGFGLYDVENGTYHDAREEDGPYMKSLKFFNRLYQAGLIDPDSMTQTYNEMAEKVTAGGTFFSIFDYAGSALYNTEEHLEAGKAMYPVVPEDATPLCYGMNVLGGNRVWTIGSKTEYPELCMAIINYLATPEGYMTYWYGPKDLCWYYDEEGNSCLTEFGETCQADKKGTKMPDEWGGGTYDEGSFQVNNTTWTRDASNPDSNGDTYNYQNWKSRRSNATYDILADWREHTGCYDTQEYMNTVNYKVSLATAYSESAQSDDLKVVWQQVAKCIVDYSWRAIYSTSDDEFNKNVEEMLAKCKEYDPDDQCLNWCLNEAALRCSYEDQVR